MMKAVAVVLMLLGLSGTFMVVTGLVLPLKMYTARTSLASTTSISTGALWSNSRSPFPSSNRLQFQSRSNTGGGTGTVLCSSIKSFNQNNNNNNDNNNSNKNKKNNADNLSTNFSFDGSNIVYGALWITMVTLAFVPNEFIPHGATVDQADIQLLQSILENPLSPNQVNELGFCLLNVFAILPILVSCFILPQNEIIETYMGKNDSPLNRSNNDGIPPQPFAIASSAIGYFAFGMYLTLRRPPYLSLPPLSLSAPEPKQQWSLLQQRGSSKTPTTATNEMTDSFSWYTKNLWDNSFLHWFVVAFIIYLPFGCHTVSAIQDSGWDTVYHGFLQLISTSKFAAISCIDLTFCHIACVSLIPYDYTIRRRYATLSTTTTTTTNTSRNKRVVDNTDNEERTLLEDEQRGQQIATLAAFVPYLGPALYVALRPQLK